MDLDTLDRSLHSSAKRLLTIIWRFRIQFSSVSIMMFIGLAVCILALTPIYEGSTLLWVSKAEIAAPVDNSISRPEASTSLVRIAESEEVISTAIQKVGLARLIDRINVTSMSLFERLRETLFHGEELQHIDFTQIQSALPKIKAAISVRAEPNSDVIRIAFRNRDPEVATDFSNALAQAFVDRRLALVSTPGAVEFFQHQKERFDEEFRTASDRLQEFATTTATYSTDDQRQLLLKRMNDLRFSLAVTQSSVSEKTGQRQALAAELRKLAPVARSTYVSSLIDSLSDDSANGGPSIPSSPTLTDRSADPPLLLVKVYQDSMAKLFQLNADLAGAERMQTEQNKQINETMGQLNTLAENEKQFIALKRAVTQASYNSTLYSRRMVEEEISRESNTERFSSVRVLQPATVPLRPVFPNYVLMALVASLFSILISAIIAVYRNSLIVTKPMRQLVGSARVEQRLG